ncbi:hypothetical protein Taro_023486, partial [Colocasia esculenta]|nr:hypothetical protein [Colocasia esculenta]
MVPVALWERVVFKCDAYRGYLFSWVPQVLCEPGLSRYLSCTVEEFEMADRRDWGGGGDEPEESTQCMIERIWESLTEIEMRMDQQAPVLPATVTPVAGGVVPTTLVSPPPGVEVPFAVPIPPPPPVRAVEEPMMQVENFLRLQSPTYTGGPNPDTVEHWIHEVERVFVTMRCPPADRVVLAAYQLRGFAQEWWRLKMQTTFAGRTEETITWTVEEAAQRAATLERSIRTQQTGVSGSGSFRIPQQSTGISKGKAPAGASSSGWAQDTSPFTVCERDKDGRRILNATVLHVTFLLPLRGGCRLHVHRVLHAGRPVDVSLMKATPSSSRIGGEVVAGFLGRFGVGAWFLACSRREDLAWSGGNTKGFSFFAFFTKVKESRRFLFHLPVQSRTTVVLGRCLQLCSFSSIVPQ